MFIMFISQDLRPKGPGLWKFLEHYTVNPHERPGAEAEQRKSQGMELRKLMQTFLSLFPSLKFID
jgi:hypothetical protein